LKIFKKLLLFFITAVFIYGVPVFPKLSGRVVDRAGILSQKTIKYLSEKLANFEKKTTNQVVVVTLKSLQGYSISDFGYQLGRHWGIGQKKRDNGVLLIIAPKEKKVRIEVGYGLEGTLTDALSSIIIQNKILPYFRKSDFNQGVISGINAILSTIKGTYKPKKEVTKKENFIPLIFFIFIFLLVFLQNLFSKKHKKFIAKIIPSGFIGFFGFVFTNSAIVGLIIMIVAFFTLLFFKVFDNGLSNGNSYWNSNNNNFFDNGGGFGGSFSGGGGGFGGGGASGGW
jgi:uncharacterized protein